MNRWMDRKLHKTVSYRIVATTEITEVILYVFFLNIAGISEANFCHLKSTYFHFTTLGIQNSIYKD